MYRVSSSHLTLLLSKNTSVFPEMMPKVLDVVGEADFFPLSTAGSKTVRTNT